MEIIQDKLFKLFQMVPGSSLTKETLIALVAFGAGLLALAVILKIIRRKTKNKVWKKYLREFPRGLTTFGLVALFLVWVRLENVPFFAMRLWWLVFWLSFAIWAFFKIRKILDLKKRLERNAFAD